MNAAGCALITEVRIDIENVVESPPSHLRDIPTE